MFRHVRFCVLAVCCLAVLLFVAGGASAGEKTPYERALEAFDDAARHSHTDPGRAALSTARATHLLELAGNAGDERAMLCLGMFYEDAPGLASKMTALRWYSRYLAKAGANSEVEEKVERLKMISGELAKISAGG